MFLNKLEIMKKVIISLQFVLLLSILIVSSVILYKMSLEKSISDWENEHFIEEMYIQDNITASIICSDNSIGVKELKLSEPRLICCYSSQSCDACLNYAKKCIKENFSKSEEASAILYLASDYSINEKFKEGNTINIGRKKLGISLDNTSLVCFFVIVDNKIEHLFIPDRNYGKYTDTYLKQIKERYFTPEF